MPIARGLWPRASIFFSKRYRELFCDGHHIAGGRGANCYPGRDPRLACLGQVEKKRAAGVAVRRLVLAPRGLTGLLNPSVKPGTKLFQPYFMNCFNCASPAVP